MLKKIYAKYNLIQGILNVLESDKPDGDEQMVPGDGQEPNLATLVPALVGQESNLATLKPEESQEPSLATLVPASVDYSDNVVNVAPLTINNASMNTQQVNFYLEIQKHK